MRCLHCGKEISDQARFCRHCGKSVVGHENEPNSAVNQSRTGVDEQTKSHAGTENFAAAGFNAEDDSTMTYPDWASPQTKRGRKHKTSTKRGPLITGVSLAVIAVAALGYTAWLQGWLGLGNQHTTSTQPKGTSQQGGGGPVATAGNVTQSGSGNASSRGTTPPTVQSIIKKTLPSLAYVDVTTNQGESIGSGFVFDNKGDIITNAHVIAGAQSIKVKLQGASSHEAKVIGIDAAHDIAELRVTAYAHKSPLKISKTPAQLGDPVIALGNPLGLKDTVTSGIVSGMNRDFSIGTTNYNNMYQISAPIAPGNSGGPLVSASSGKVIGIDTAGVTHESGNIGFAIPITQVADKLQRWAKHPMSASSVQVQLQQAEKIEQASSSNGGNTSGGGGGANGGSGGTGNSAGAGIGNSTGNSTGAGNSIGSPGSPGGNPGVTAGTLQSESLKLISAYYYDLNQQDYLDAYAMLGQSMQSKTSYSAFAKGYSNTLQSSVQNAMFSPINKNSGKVSFTLVAQEVTSQGQTQTSTYKVVDTCGYEDGQLRIEQSNMKLVNRKKG